MVTLRRMLMLGWPALIVIAVNARGLLGTMLGDRWVVAGPIVVLFAVLYGLAVAVSLNVHVFKAIGKPNIMTRFMVARSVVSIPTYLGAAQYGGVGRAAGRVVLAGLFSPITTTLAARALGITAKMFWREVLFRPILVAATVLATGLLVRETAPLDASSLVINACIGLLVPAGALWYWEKGMFSRTAATMRAREKVDYA